MERVIIMRGVSGSGKSTHAKTYVAATVSADHYFMTEDENGHVEYRFDASKLSDAHTYCMSEFLRLIRDGVKTIVVDNTATKVAEVTPYRLVALAMGYDVKVVRMVCAAAKAAIRNTHGVPFATIMRMAENFENMPAFLGGESLINT